MSEFAEKNYAAAAAACRQEWSYPYAWSKQLSTKLRVDIADLFSKIVFEVNLKN